MKVIVAGMSKTGTKTISAALTMLGYTVYDYPEHCYLLVDEYTKIHQEGPSNELFQQMYKNADAVVDHPANFYWKEISDAFPEAKIILTVRNSEEEWVRSYVDFMKMLDKNIFFRCLLLLSPTSRKAQRFHDDFGRISLAFGDTSRIRWMKYVNEHLAKKIYRQHNEYVMKCVPEDKLLVYKVSEGWEPLCKFLGEAVPDEAFPHKNKGGQYVQEMPGDKAFKKVVNEMYISSAVICITAVCGVTAGLLLHRYGLPSAPKTFIKNFFS